MTEDAKTRLVRLMKETIAHSTQHVKAGGIPFTAMVVDRDGTVLGRGTNTVTAMNDPTAHAEVEAIRDACRAKRTSYLPGAVLLASGEPCAMCYMNALHAGIAEIHYAVDRDEAAGMGFDYRFTYSLFAQDPQTWHTPSVGRLEVPGAIAPFEEFHALRTSRQ
ncbi:nucleoside deaminase [Ruegeria profundi]|uniref:Deaminase n=1 Tax=Ruegeria profundi TaxID=1685378 RepID=A0A0X3TRW4_9RHOB|nr:nucleoside deaminase [Ruegeria profundi]KUJ78475.1 deaminase [Ruegeria profundi]